MTIQSLSPPPTRDARVLLETERFEVRWYSWFSKLVDRLNGNLASGFTGTITTAALTGGGAQGSMTFQNGILVSQVQAT